MLYYSAKSQCMVPAHTFINTN